MEIKDFEAKLKALAEALKTEFQSIRGNRPSPKMVEDIKVDCYNQQLPIKALASISIILPKEININVWDKSAVNAVAKAVENSNLKVTANTEGNLIRINLPPLTEERKKELEKIVRKTMEETRIKIRGLRDEINKEIKRKEDNKELSEDAAFRKKQEVQNIVDKINEEIEKLLDAKIQEISV